MAVTHTDARSGIDGIDTYWCQKWDCWQCTNWCQNWDWWQWHILMPEVWLVALTHIDARSGIDGSDTYWCQKWNWWHWHILMTEVGLMAVTHIGVRSGIDGIDTYWCKKWIWWQWHILMPEVGLMAVTHIGVRSGIDGIDTYLCQKWVSWQWHTLVSDVDLMAMTQFGPRSGSCGRDRSEGPDISGDGKELVTLYTVSHIFCLMPVCSLGALAIDQGMPLLFVAIFSISLLLYPISFVSFSVSLPGVLWPSSASSVEVSMWWLDLWRFLKDSKAYVLSTSMFSTHKTAYIYLLCCSYVKLCCSVSVHAWNVSTGGCNGCWFSWRNWCVGSRWSHSNHRRDVSPIDIKHWYVLWISIYFWTVALPNVSRNL